MSRMSRESMFRRILTWGDVQMPVESSDLWEAIGLRWILWPGDERMAPEELGRRIDDCLVEWICLQHQYLKNGYIGHEAIKWIVDWLEECMQEDPALRAFATILRSRDGLPLASETYLELTKREVLYGGKPRPFPKEGFRFARVLLADFIDQENWQVDWDGRIFTSLLVDSWMYSRDRRQLRRILDNSLRSPTVWDAVQHICKELARRGQDVPPELLTWFFRAYHGPWKRPEAGSAPRNRPRKLGYMLRDNEIRHTVDLLSQVGMRKSAGRTVVAEVLHLSESRIQQVCREPYWYTFELQEHAMKSLDPYSPHIRVES